VKDDPRLEQHSRETLRKRSFTGERCIALAYDGPWSAADEVENDEDRESYASDAVSDILTALFGIPGTFGPERNGGGRLVSEPDYEAIDKASAFMQRALDSWRGDAEDYIVAEADEVELDDHSGFVPTDDLADAWERYQRGDEVKPYELRELDDQRTTWALEQATS
jgi:hypothetical protein